METNKEPQDALLIWHLVEKRRMIPIEEICRYIGKTREGVMLIITRLVKENKVKLINNDSVAHIEVTITEIYY